MNIADRALPSSLDTEKIILGALLLSDEGWFDVSSRIRGGDFFRDAHRRIFEAMSRLADRRIRIDFVTLKDELLRTSDLEEVGGPAYLSALTDGLPRVSNLPAYCDIVREKARLRRLIQLYNKLVGEAYEAERTSTEIVDVSIKQLFEMAEVGSNSSMKAQAAIKEYVEALSAGTLLDPLPTGFADVDDLLGGLNRHELTIIAARPSVGKSTLALGMAARMALKGVPVAFFSLEMRVETLAAQLLAWRSKVPAHTVRLKRANEDEYKRISEAWTSAPDIPLYLQRVRSLTEIMARARRLKDEHDVKCAVIDYIQLLGGEGRFENRQAEVAYISRVLKTRLAEDEGLAVVGLSQLKRQADGKGKKLDRRPQLSDLRESGALEQDADLAILLYRPEVEKATDENRGICEAIVAKNRTGPTGIVKLYFNKDLARFSDWRVS